MNDRFRFRVWDNINDEWLEITPKPLLLDINNGYLDGFYCGEEAFNRRYTLEQCTGLKDKNGKLIYEGDILKPNGNPITREVVYEDGSYWAKDTMYFHDKCHIYQWWIDECGYEIIGNIHEKESK